MWLTLDDKSPLSLSRQICSQIRALILRGDLPAGHRLPSTRQLGKELGVALLNGLFWAVVVGAVATAWFGNSALGLVFGIAILINLTNGAVCGTLIPLALVRFGIDPALAGGVLLTALTDVIGFVAFLAMATVFIL